MRLSICLKFIISDLSKFVRIYIFTQEGFGDQEFSEGFGGSGGAILHGIEKSSSKRGSSYHSSKSATRKTGKGTYVYIVAIIFKLLLRTCVLAN